MGAIPNSQGQIPTGIKYDASLNQTMPSFDVIDEEIKKSLSEKRLSFCNKCKNKIIQGKLICKMCGCGMEYRSTLIFPLDEEGYAYTRINPDNTRNYVCKLKKW